jgi:hypothetical protein
VETDTETRLPDIPNGVRVTNPFEGTATLLPLTPPLFTPEVLVCGGSNTSDTIPVEELSSQDPTSDQCSRITLTPEGIRTGWVVERMLEGRTMSEMILMPDGRVMIINGAQTGYVGIGSVKDPIGNQSNADHPVYVDGLCDYHLHRLVADHGPYAYRFKPVLYTPSAPLGRRFSNQGMPSSEIARMYHSTATLTPNGWVVLLLLHILVLTRVWFLETFSLQDPALTWA